MSLILGSKIPELMQGYPTISDKYDVVPAVLDNTSAAVKAGTPVILGSTAGRYTAPASGATIEQYAGFVLATNVKVPNTYPAHMVDQTYVAGDAFNLMIRGFIAVPVGSAATVASIVNGAPVYVTLATGAIVTATEAAEGTVQLPGAYFTGTTTLVSGKIKQATVGTAVLLAEVAYHAL